MRAVRSLRSLTSPRSAVEMLERRQLLSVTLGTNIVANGSAEANTGSATGNNVITPTGWTVNGTPTVVQYGAPGFPTPTGNGPPQRGKNFFAGGPNNSESDLFQTVDVSNLAASIDAHQIKYNLSAYLGGNGSQADNATVFASFQSSGGFNGQDNIGPVTATNRFNETGLISASKEGLIPVGTRKIQVQVHFEGDTGPYNDGYADTVSMVLTSTVTTGKITGSVFNDINGDGTKQSTEGGLANVTVFVDKNNNGVLDAGEISTKTAANGSYTISGVAPGTYSVLEIVPPTYRATTPFAALVTVTAGGSVFAGNFGDSQTVLITGKVFNDANGDKKQDNGEKGIAGATVYLDFNNNGQLDSFELKTTTLSNGSFRFILPFGSYVVREVLPSGKVFTIGGSGYSLNLAKGKVSALLLFGDK